MIRASFLHKTRQILLKRRELLRRSIDTELTMLGRNRMLRPVGDVGDEAQEGVDDESVSRAAQVESRELQAIDEALARINEGQYGVCVNCGENISTARLQALPYATLCIACQRDSETGKLREGETDEGQPHPPTNRTRLQPSNRGLVK